MKQLNQLPSEQALAPTGGGLSDQIPLPQPLPLSPQADTQKQSSPLAHPEPLQASIQAGGLQSSNGKPHVLTGKNELTIPNSTLAGTANWVLTELQVRGLIQFEIVHIGREDFYRAVFSTSVWTVANGVLTLKEA